jgi:sugar phosphate isomerase/epimerase
MRSAITVSLVPEAKGGPFVYWDGLESACAEAGSLGFDAVEIFPPSAGAIARTDLGVLLKRHQLQVAAVGTGGGWVVHQLTLTHADVDVRRRARDFIREIIDVAGEFGAPAIIGSMQGRWDSGMSREQALKHLADAVEDLGSHAARHGVPVLYEPLNRYETNLFNRLGDTARWLANLGTRNVRILADLFHMNIEEANSAAALREAGGWVGHVHFADSNRRAIGMGHTDVTPVMAALRELNYGGYLSAEILPLPDSKSAAARTMAAFRRHVLEL